MKNMSSTPQSFYYEWILMALFAFVSQLHAENVTQIKITNTIEVPRQQFSPIGTQAFGGIGQVNYAAGSLIVDGGFEPVEMRTLRRIIETGKDERGPYFKVDQGGAGFSALFYDGTFSGTKFKAYRIVDASGNKLPPMPEKSTWWGDIIDTTKAERMVPLGLFDIPSKGEQGFPVGGWEAHSPPTWKEYIDLKSNNPKAFNDMRDKWRVYYKSGQTELYLDDIVVFQKSALQFDPADFHPRMHLKYANATKWEGSAKLSRVFHGSNFPGEFNGGESCLMIETPDALNSNLAKAGTFAWHKLFGGKDPKTNPATNWYGQLEPGLTYVYEAWMKSEGYDQAPTVHLGFCDNLGRKSYFGIPIGKDFIVEKAWKKYQFTFIAPECPDGKKSNFGAAIFIPNGGKVFVDNAKLAPVYEPDDKDKPFVVNRTILKTFLKSQPTQGKKGSWRTWSVHNEKSMLSNLDWHADTNYNPSLPKAMEIMYATGSSPENRVVPWINTQIMHDAEDHRGLIEYLAAPYDPKTDTPKTKPYAAKRFEQRGHGRPWSDDFREFVIELGNEGWHNRKGVSYIGVGRYGAIHQFGKDYGLYCRMMIEEIHKSPHWNSEVDKKIQIGINANYSSKIKDGQVSGFGPEATAACQIHDFETHANYYGPRWELNEKHITQATDKQYQNYLLSGLTSLQDQYQSYEKVLALNNKNMGTNIRIAGYEGGASGYSTDIRDPKHPSNILGKSKVMAIAGVDAWMEAYRHGWAYQTNFLFKQGRNWANFYPMGQGFRPIPSWQAMTMINRIMGGDIVEVKSENSPLIKITETNEKKIKQLMKRNQPISIDYPMIGAYAMRKEKVWTVAVINRSLNQILSSKVQLPFSVASNITRHWLTGSAKDINEFELLVDWKQETLEPSLIQEGQFEVSSEPSSLQIFEIIE